jgi:ketosteroid isomerase-like protein
MELVPVKVRTWAGWIGLAVLSLPSAAMAQIFLSPAPADQALVQAISQGDKQAATLLLDADFSVTDSSGKTLPKSEAVANLRQLSVGDADLKAHEYGNVAYLTGTGQTSSGKIRIVRVWVKKENNWKAILQQDTFIVGKSATPQATVPVGTSCDNPCKSIPYKAPSAEAAAVVASWEALEDAVNHRDADGWARHVADEFVFNVKEDGNPLTKADRVAIIRKQAQGTTVTDIGTVVPDSMKVWIFGDSAVMSDEQQPTQGGPPYRAMRIWVKRDGRWQLVYSQQTVIETAATSSHSSSVKK